MTLADTNVLLRGIQRDNVELRSVARAALKRLYRRGDSVCVFPQNLIELLNVCTRPTWKISGATLASSSSIPKT